MPNTNPYPPTSYRPRLREQSLNDPHHPYHQHTINHRIMMLRDDEEEVALPGPLFSRLPQYDVMEEGQEGREEGQKQEKEAADASLRLKEAKRKNHGRLTCSHPGCT